MPAGAAAAKAVAARRKRVKGSYGWLSKHTSDSDLKLTLNTNFFGDGIGAWQYLIMYRAPVNTLTLREMDNKWNAIDLLADVGVADDSMMQLA